MKKKYSFYDWCVDNDALEYLDQWNYETNKRSPKEVGACSNDKFAFKCLKNNEHQDRYIRLSCLTKQKEKRIICYECRSFGQWCLDHDNEIYIKLWDNKLNERTPFNVSFSSNKKFYFHCRNWNCNHHSELKRLDNFTMGQYNSMRCNQCLSFGQYLIDIYGDTAIETYWDYDKNKEIDPMEIPAQWNKKIWLKCNNENHPSYEVTCGHYYDGTRCPYCAHKSKIPILEDSLGHLYPKSIDVWSDKNKKNVFEIYPNSNKNAYWKCENKVHDDFYKQINVMTRDGFHCPACSLEMKNSYLQEKVYNYITYLGYNVLTEHNCNILPRSIYNNKPLPYDNEIPDLKLIIEVNGKQHYWEDCSWYKHLAVRNGITAHEEFERRKEYDAYKKQYALDHNYYYLEIPYWEENDDNYTNIINKKINEILN